MLQKIILKKYLHVLCLTGLSAIFLAGCQESGSDEKKWEGEPLFKRLHPDSSGIAFVNEVANTPEFSFLDYLYFYNGGGVSAGDINNDGLTDLYFVSNQGKNKLYLNKGNFKFEEVAEKAGVTGKATWQTGVTMADVNGDGFLDLYVCAVSNYKGLTGSNELYINNGDGTFTERAKEFGLAFEGFSTQAAFFDYDHDGDLDVYLLTHAVHTSLSYGRVSTRALTRDTEAGDYLFRNEGGKRFTDVSEKAGIYAAPMGYGLGISVGDLNDDGWDDIYVANDFHEDDYYYINNQDGTFTEALRRHFSHTSKFSMGNDMADLNNDGLLDVFTVDMYPEDPAVEKATAGEDPLDVYLYKLQFGFYNQYTRNTLQLNLGGERFVDVGAMSGVAATDWSWSPLLADFDNDGIKDIFVSNGIVRRPNDLEYLKFVSSPEVTMQVVRRETLDREMISRMPDGRAHNYLYQGTDSLPYIDRSFDWGFGDANYANGALYADLDNDGDLDLITNNINELAGIYENQANRTQANSYLKVSLKGDQLNTFGVGAKVYIKTAKGWHYQHNMPTRGFMSSVEPTLTFGVGKATILDSVVVVWPDQKAEIRTAVKPNQLLTFRQTAATTSFSFRKPKPPIFENISTATLLDYKHIENAYYDFTREPLMPFKVSTEGPAMAIGDVNGDGLDDMYLGGAKLQPGQLYLQQPGGTWMRKNEMALQRDTLYEDVDAIFFDADNDKDLDLYVVSGGNEFFGEAPALLDRLYRNDGKGNFVQDAKALPAMFANKGCVVPFDYDNDGDIDLFVGGRVTAYAYGNIPDSYLLINDGKGNFSDGTATFAPELRKAGMVTDAVWSDFDGDGDVDLLVVGDWMPVRVFKNEKGKLSPQETSLNQRTGFWQVIEKADLDGDGDDDYVVGNMGTNTKFRRGAGGKLRMYAGDFLNVNKMDHLLAYSVEDKFYPVSLKDEISKSIPYINQRFPNYRDFSGKTIEQIFKSNELDAAELREVNTFESIWIENKGKGEFVVHPLPFLAQASKVFAVEISDINGDKKPDIILGGNFYSVSTYQGRYDGSHGLILENAGKGQWKTLLPTDTGFLLDGEIRHIKAVRTPTGTVFAVIRNNDTPLFFKPKP
ncbi:VCBS repeat-containing protein [Arundinibacter roseus]|uniref:RNA-binding protein n=1 Tax=Arundinibacter roseus TaxID=2070510 RepID=A0A4R4K071_9BACT|nr:VCBS repeat-containing protein [Arundinibacter roseus]TDB59852.1 RNA-binding protein [Arundinibacter roseus]